MTVTLDEIRANYPEYKDVPDERLLRGLHQKFYPGVPFDQFMAMARGQRSTQNPQQQGEMPWADVAKGAIMNLPGSALNVAGAMAQPFIHPIDTAGALSDVAVGGVSKLLSADDPRERAAEAVGGFFADRYGSIEGFKKALSEDPAGIMADMAAVVTGGGALAGKLGASAGKAVQKVGRLSSPATAVRAVTERAPGVVGKGAAELVGMLTRAGADPFKEAFAAGRGSVIGGTVGEMISSDYLGNLRGKVPVEDVVDMARGALKVARGDVSDAYGVNKARWADDPSLLDLTPIQKAVADSYRFGTYEGEVINEKAAKMSRKMDEILNLGKTGKSGDDISPWISKDPDTFHTVEGINKLKQKINTLREKTKPGTQARGAVDSVYGAISEQLAQQSPAYAETMRQFSEPTKALDDVQKTLSLGDQATKDTAIRKLQSSMRNNVNTTFGRRRALVDVLAEDGGAVTLPAALAGQSLNSWAPRGLGGITGPGVLVGGAAVNPAILAAAPLFMPRAMGEAAYYTGKVAGKASDLAEKTKLAALLRASGKLNPQVQYQIGRNKETVGKLSQLLTGR
ncbi:MAG: hypothetical protein H7829_17195 [Magnetococcus sp. THC-1_WYH]